MDLKNISKLGTIRSFRRDELFFLEGDQGDEMYLILSGKATVFREGITGFREILGHILPGDFFGEMALLEGLPRSAGVMASEDSKVLAIPKRQLFSLIQAEPIMAVRIMKSICGRVRQQNETISQLRKKLQTASLKGGPENDTRMPVTQGACQQSGKLLHIKAGEFDQQFLTPIKINCPVCNGGFVAQQAKTSHLSQEANVSFEEEGRYRMVDFEPLWYRVWLCPHCNYANFDSNFFQIGHNEREKLHAALRDLETTASFSSPRSLAEVIRSYQLALYSAEARNTSAIVLGRIWLNLSWLYKDAKDTANRGIAASNAHQCFRQVYDRQEIDLLSTDGQYLCFVLGELSLNCGHKRESRRYYQQLLRNPSAKKSFVKMAQARLSALS